jgi:hypothetical protein
LIKNSFADVIWRRQEREMGGKIQTAIDTYPDIITQHAPLHVEEYMPENHSRRRLGVFGRRMTPHAPSESRVGVETEGAFSDAPHSCQWEKNG